MKSVLICGLMAGALMMSTSAMADLAMAKKEGCTACHSVDKKLVGPSYRDVAKKYAGDKGAQAKLEEKVRKGGSGVWGAIPMTPHPNIKEADLKSLVKWILAGAK
jgi:cytochrome c